MSNRLQDFITDPLRKDHRALGMAGGAERAGLAGEGQEVAMLDFPIFLSYYLLTI